MMNLQVTLIFRQSWNIEILYNKLVVTTRAMNNIALLLIWLIGLVQAADSKIYLSTKEAYCCLIFPSVYTITTLQPKRTLT